MATKKKPSAKQLAARAKFAAMARARAKAAKGKKTITKKTTTKKVGEVYYFGDGEKVRWTQLKEGQKYEWIMGAGYQEVKYIGPESKHKNIRYGTKVGAGAFIFQFDDGSYTNLSPSAVNMYLRTIPGKSVTGTKKTKKIGSLLPEHKPFFKKITKATAKKRFIENMEVYGLYDDGSESLIESLNDLDNRGIYAYGYEIKSGTMGKTTTSRHTDTKSHNVRINVLSGIKDTIYNDLKKIESNIEKLNDALIRNKQKMKLSPYKTQFWKNYYSKHNAEIVKMISSLKKQKTELKKNI